MAVASGSLWRSGRAQLMIRRIRLLIRTTISEYTYLLISTYTEFISLLFSALNTERQPFQQRVHPQETEENIISGAIPGPWTDDLNLT